MYNNNLIYSGLWKNDQKHGYGELKYFQNVQKGIWDNDAFSGYGQHIYPTDEVYEGDLVDFKRHGYGKFEYQNRDIYIG